VHSLARFIMREQDEEDEEEDARVTNGSPREFYRRR
jgi:hypothetical protein